VSSWPLVGLPRRGLRPRATPWWPVYSARWSSARYTCDSAGSMASIWLARRRCRASGSHPSASSPRRCRHVRREGSWVSPASAPASAAVRCLVCSSVSAPSVNDSWVHTRMPRSPAPAPAPAPEAPVPAVSRLWAPIRLVKACTSIAPAYRQATVPDSILLATRQPAPSAPVRSSPLPRVPVPVPPPAGWPAVPAPSPPACCPDAESSPSRAAGSAPAASVSPNRGPGAGSVPCCLISSEIRDRDTPSLRPISAWVRPCPAHWRACRSRAGLRIGGRPIWWTSPPAPCSRERERIRDTWEGWMPNAAATVLPWKRLPSVSEQMTRSRISRSPAPKADSSRGPACTATTRPSSVRVTRSGHGCGMPGSCWPSIKASIPAEGHNRLTYRPLRGDSFPSSQVPARPRRPPAARSGTGEADRADPDCARAGLPRFRHRPSGGEPPGQARIQSTITGDLGTHSSRQCRAMSGAGGHVGGQYVVRVAVEVLAGPVVTHRGARVGVAGGDLDIPQVHAGIEHGRNEGVPQHMRVWPGNPDPCCLGQAPQPAGGGVAVHAGAAAVEQDGAAGASADCAVDGPADGWWQRDEYDLGAFAAHAQHPVAVFFAEVGDVGPGGFEDPQAEQPEHGHQGEVARAG